MQFKETPRIIHNYMCEWEPEESSEEPEETPNIHTSYENFGKCIGRISAVIASDNSGTLYNTEPHFQGTELVYHIESRSDEE